MKLSAEDYRRHYRDLSDGELLAIRREDLVDAAQKAYDAEIAQREISVETEAGEEAAFDESAEDTSDIPPEPVEIPPDAETVQVALLVDSATSRYALATLWKAHIPAVLTERPKAAGRYAAGCFGLMVPNSCAEPARELLAGYLTSNNQTLVRMWLEKDWTPDGLELDDFDVTVDDHFGEDYKVAARFTITGVNPETRKNVELRGLGIIHVEDGKIGEHWIRLDI
jgi:hypothetical protein